MLAMSAASYQAPVFAEIDGRCFPRTCQQPPVARLFLLFVGCSLSQKNASHWYRTCWLYSSAASAALASVENFVADPQRGSKKTILTRFVFFGTAASPCHACY